MRHANPLPPLGLTFALLPPFFSSFPAAVAAAGAFLGFVFFGGSNGVPVTRSKSPLRAISSAITGPSESLSAPPAFKLQKCVVREGNHEITDEGFCAMFTHPGVDAFGGTYKNSCRTGERRRAYRLVRTGMDESKSSKPQQLQKKREADAIYQPAGRSTPSPPATVKPSYEWMYWEFNMVTALTACCTQFFSDFRRT